MNVAISRFILFGALLTFFSCQDTGGPVKKAQTEARIVFLSNRDRPARQFDIFTMRPDGGELVKLTTDLTSVTSLSSPQFSPDQEQILFFASRGLDKKLQLMSAHGSDVRTLVDVNIDKPEPQFSPKGDQIVFVSKVGKNRQIHIINADGSKLTNLSNNEYDEFEPRFSPDGSQILFTSSREGKRSVYTMKPNGTGLIKRTHESATHSHPRFSPDGAKIAYASIVGRNSDIFILKLGGNGTAGENLTDTRTFESEPQFSPDGSKILYISSLRGMRYRDILIQNLATGAIRNLTESLNFVNRPVSFSRDGTKLLFESMHASNSEVYIADLEGRHLMNLTNDPKWDCAPSF